MTDAQVKAALNEYHVLAVTIWGESRGEPVEGRIFVGSVIRNRVNHPKRFGDSYDAVCLKRAQFSCWFEAGGQANYQAVMRLARQLVEVDHAESRAALTDPVWIESLFVAEGIIGGQLRDNSAGANHFLTKALYRIKPPAWAVGKKPVATVGAHIGFLL